MNFDENISMLSMAFYQVLLVSGPILALALGIGLLIGITQAATSINEMTLSFVPKVIVVMLGIGLLGNFFMMGLVDYFNFIFDQVAGVGQNLIRKKFFMNGQIKQCVIDGYIVVLLIFIAGKQQHIQYLLLLCLP